jgi:hypothetical protein
VAEEEAAAARRAEEKRISAEQARAAAEAVAAAAAKEKEEENEASRTAAERMPPPRARPPPPPPPVDVSPDLSAAAPSEPAEALADAETPPAAEPQPSEASPAPAPPDSSPRRSSSRASGFSLFASKSKPKPPPPPDAPPADSADSALPQPSAEAPAGVQSALIAALEMPIGGGAVPSPPAVNGNVRSEEDHEFLGLDSHEAMRRTARDVASRLSFSPAKALKEHFETDGGVRQ